ncbi:MAG TPA: AAA family ATPase, partial [Planctomycetota bacterium]|nr:AAA family ATPase [Planctomycetota bacterium]
MGSARRILVIGPEDELAPELEDALERSDLDRVLTRYEPDFRRALLALRRFRPDLILLPLGARRQFDHFLREIARLAPGVRLAAVVGAPGATDVIRAARSGIDEFLERPLRASDIVRIVLRSPGASRPAAAGGTIACVASNKGGVGRTTVAVDLACRLARAHADRVLLVDASPQVGGCALALDLQDASTVADALREEDRLDPVMLRELATPHACGLRVLGSPRESGAPEIDGDALFRLLTVARRAFDCVVVDTSPLLDPVSLAVLDVSDLVYVVTNATRPGVLGVERYLRTLDRL